MNARKALTIPAVSRAVQILSSDAARLPIGIQKQSGSDWEPVQVDALLDLLNVSPNQLETAHEWRSLSARDVLLYGNSLSMIVRTGSGAVDRIVRQPFGTWAIDWNYTTFALSYNVTGVGKVSPDDVLHFRTDGDEQFWGRSPIDTHQEVLQGILSMYSAARRTFGSTLGKVSLSSPELLSPEAVSRVAEKFAEVHGSADNWSKPIVTGGGMEAKVFQQELSRNEYVACQNFGVSDVGRIFGIPASMLYASDQAGMTSSGTAPRETNGYIETALKPLVSRMAAQLSLKLLPPSQRINFDVRGISRGSYGESIASLRQAIDASIMSAAEARQALDLPPVDGEEGEALASFVISKNYTQQSSADADDSGIMADATRYDD